MTSSMRDLKVYTTHPHSCSYLDEQEATTLFVDPRQPVDKLLYSNLSLLVSAQRQPHLPPPLHPLRRLCPGPYPGNPVPAASRPGPHLEAQPGPAGAPH